MALNWQKHRIRCRNLQLRFLNSVIFHSVCELGWRRFVAFRDEPVSGSIGEQRLDCQARLVQLAFVGAFLSSDRPTGAGAVKSKNSGTFVNDTLDLTVQRYQCGRRISQLRFLDAALFRSIGINGSKVVPTAEHLTGFQFPQLFEFILLPIQFGNLE